MSFVNLIITKDCRGSEDGIHVKSFTASPEPQPVEEKLAGVFVAQKWATVPVVGKPGAVEKKVVAPDTKTIVQDEVKADADVKKK